MKMKTKSVLETVVLKNVTHTKLVGVYLYNENSFLQNLGSPPQKKPKYLTPSLYFRELPSLLKNKLAITFKC